MEIPADLVIISSSELDSMCFIETKNLDGETNLKVRFGIHELSFVKSPLDCNLIEGYLEIENPTAHLYNFNGFAKLQLPQGFHNFINKR